MAIYILIEESTMVPTMMWSIFLSFGAAKAAESSVTLSPGDWVSVQFGEQCEVSADDWYLSADRSDIIEDWGIEVTVRDAFALSTGPSTVAFEINGAKVTSDSNPWGEADMFMGFGDGAKYISLAVDFDGNMFNWGHTNEVRGILVFPPCAEAGGSLATGSVSDVLSDSVSYHSTDPRYAVRDALAGGDRDQWEALGGSRVDNGDTWPVTIEIENDVAANEVTFRFSSASVAAECVYSDTFSGSEFVFGILPEPENGDKDNFHIHSIGVTARSGGADATDAAEFPFSGTAVAGQMIGSLDIADDMHFELGVTINSANAAEQSTVNILNCGGVVFGARSTYNAILDGYHWTYFVSVMGSEVSCWSLDGSPTFEGYPGLCHPTPGETYYLKIDFDGDSVSIRYGTRPAEVDVVYSASKEQHATSEGQQCYVSDPNLVAADATISDFVVYSQEPLTAEHMALAAEENADTNAHITSEVTASSSSPDFVWLAIGISIGFAVFAVVALLIGVVVLVKRKKSGTKEETEMTQKVEIPEMSASIDIESAGTSSP